MQNNIVKIALPINCNALSVAALFNEISGGDDFFIKRIGVALKLME